MRNFVVDMADARPIWRVPDWVLTRLRRRLPDDWSLVRVGALADGTGDGGGGASAEALEAVADAEVYCGYGIAADVIEAGERLRWVHTGTAGVGASLSAALLARDIVFTNSAAVMAPPIADTVLAMMLHFARGLDIVVRAQSAARWSRSAFDGEGSPVRELGECTVGIIGYGGIGREVATRALAFGARVVAWKRREAPQPEGVKLVYGPEGLRRVLESSDYLVLALPDTPATRGLLDGRALALMKPDAVLINVARGRLVDEATLADALLAGRLRGAGLDVFATEPLPADHPFWKLDNVLVTPHISAYSHRFWEREVELIEDNLNRYLEGRPLRNLVDKEAGY